MECRGNSKSLLHQQGSSRDHVSGLHRRRGSTFTQITWGETAVGIPTGEYSSKAKFSRSQRLVLTSSQMQALTSTKFWNKQSPIRWREIRQYFYSAWTFLRDPSFRPRNPSCSIHLVCGGLVHHIHWSSILQAFSSLFANACPVQA